MRKFIKTLSLFVASVPLIAARAAVASPSEHNEDVAPPMPNLDPVQLRPLNHGLDNLFAGHRSHASHASHASHYSGATGGGSNSAPQADAPTYNQAPKTETSPTIPPSTPTPVPHLSIAEKRKLQIMRVQLALVSLGLYSGTVDGELNNGTQESIQRFQQVKGLPASGLMTTDTLNALGVMAVQ